MFAVPELIQQVIIALALGGLVGLERENQPQRKYAGLRTMGLLAAIGPAVVDIASSLGSVFPVAVYLSFAAAVSLSIVYVRYSIKGEEIGFTTSVAVFVVAVLGLLAGYNLYIEAAAITIISVLLLAEREVLHDKARSLSDQEIVDAMKLGALVFVLLPILPDKAVGPFNAVNLHQVLLLTIFVLLLEFAAFLAMRRFGRTRGIQVTGLLGGAASSFASTGVISRLVNEERSGVKTAASAIMLGTFSMVVRNAVISGSLRLGILEFIALPFGAMSASFLLFAYLNSRNGEVNEGDLEDISSPFSFKTAAKFAAIFVGVSLLSAAGERFLGSAGLYISAFAGGIASSAAVAASAVSLIDSGVASLEVGGGMVLVSILGSITSKIALIEFARATELRKYVYPYLFVASAIGLAVFFLV